MFNLIYFVLQIYVFWIIIYKIKLFKKSMNKLKKSNSCKREECNYTNKLSYTWYSISRVGDLTFLHSLVDNTFSFKHLRFWLRYKAKEKLITLAQSKQLYNKIAHRLILFSPYRLILQNKDYWTSLEGVEFLGARSFTRSPQRNHMKRK